MVRFWFDLMLVTYDTSLSLKNLVLCLMFGLLDHVYDVYSSPTHLGSFTEFSSGCVFYTTFINLCCNTF